MKNAPFPSQAFLGIIPPNSAPALVRLWPPNHCKPFRSEPKMRTIIIPAIVLAGVLAMGVDNSRQLTRCEATGRGPAECRLLVLGR